MHSNEEVQKKASQVAITLIPGKLAIRYPETSKHLVLDSVAITENGTESNLPLVDFVLKDAEGNKYYVMATGRIVNLISAAVKGVNLRNHGTEEP